MIQFDIAKRWELPCQTGEELQRQTGRLESDVSGSGAATVVSETSQRKDVFVYVSPPPAPFPRVFPGL
jgi:hypothetical protein